MLEREAHLQEPAQSVVSQQTMLETWNGTLQEQQKKLEERETHAVSAKVDDLKGFEAKMRFQRELPSPYYKCTIMKPKRTTCMSCL